MSTPLELADAMLGHAVDALEALAPTTLWPLVPERSYVAHSDLVTFDCAQLTVNLTRMKPKPLEPRAEQCVVLWQATLTVQLLRCVTALDPEAETPEAMIPAAETLDAENRRLLLEGHAIAKHLSRKWAEGEWPPDGRCSDVKWGALEPIPPTDLAGWRLAVDVQL